MGDQMLGEDGFDIAEDNGQGESLEDSDDAF